MTSTTTARRSRSTAPASTSNAVDFRTRRTESIAVTPALARRWLDWYDDDSGQVYNRTPGAVHVVKMARDMTNNHWYDTGVPLIVGTHGKVLDGRQRLEAVILSDQTITFDVKFGIDPAAQHAMDRVRKRTVANDLQMRNVPNSTVIAAVVSLVLHWRTGKILDKREAPTEYEQLDFAAEHGEALQLAVHQGNVVNNRLPSMTLTVVAAAFFEAVRIDEDACITFFNQLATGTGPNLEDGSPIVTLRNILIREIGKPKPPRHAQLYRLVYAWNLWRDGRTRKTLPIPATLTSETFPRMK